MKVRSYLFGFLIMGLTSCKIGPEPINYGSDGCHYCSMTIVDKQHAAEIVTKKGKPFKFDATECMMNYLKEVDNTSIALFLVNDYAEPGLLIDATKATYLISENIPSPMGAYLSAFGSRKLAEAAQATNKGSLYSWEELQLQFNK